MKQERSTVTLRALEGRPLLDPAVRDIVIATAHAIAERNGVTLVALEAGDQALTVELAGSRLMALGFAAELRRLTNAWYARKYGGPTGEKSLWGEPRGDDDPSFPLDWEV